MIKSGIIVKSVGGVFTVLDETDSKHVCYSPKKLRYKDGDILIGDFVCFESLKSGKGVITEVKPRKNKLARPEIANVDVCFIVLAREPQPDFYLADKALVNCFYENIEPVIVVNKSDLQSDTYELAKKNYGAVADVLSVSVKNDSVNLLEPYIRGKSACFAGQSAVGKTSIINALIPSASGVVGVLSEKTGRGTHTTRHASLYRVFGGFLADTCGFSLCDVKNIKSEDLRLYLDDFVEISRDCKYPSCTHTAEPNCAVKSAVERGEIFRDRYMRYLDEYGELKENEKNRY